MGSDSGLPMALLQIFMNGTRFGLYPTAKRILRQRVPYTVPDSVVDLLAGFGPSSGISERR